MLVEKDIRSLMEERYIKPMKELSKSVEDTKKEIKEEIRNVKNSKNKEYKLLHFRRVMEMLIQSNMILTVTTLSSNAVIAIRKDNFLQYIDDRYYTPFHLGCFMDIFKVETKNFKSISNNLTTEPHIGLVINYIIEHFTNTFTRFINRNSEYYYIYEFFYRNGIKIKKVLSYLNSYHYIKSEEWINLYNVDIETIKDEINEIFEDLEGLLEKI